MDSIPDWLQLLNEDDLAFLKRFVLNSGSLKETAREYGISYPTVRLRLDRLIAKLQAIEASASRGTFERMLRARYAEGDLSDATFKDLLRAYRSEDDTP